MLPSNAPDWEAANPPPNKVGPRVSGGIIVTLVLLVGLIAVIAFAVTRLPTTPVARSAAPATPAQSSAPAAGGGVTADAATQQSIQDVIRKVDDAQVQAIATNDPQMSIATATPEFNAEQAAGNQDLLDNGVTEVKLLNLEWGQITVSGNSASATVYETWSMTLDDGTTVQSRDRNIYTLVKDNSGNWVVQADVHPDQPSAPATH